MPSNRLTRLGKLERRLAPREQPHQADVGHAWQQPDGSILVEGYESVEAFRAARPGAMLLIVKVQQGRPAEEVRP